MNENVVDILIYLYENYMDGDQPPPDDQNALRQDLAEVGFSQNEIEKAFSWLDELAKQIDHPPTPVKQANATRIFSNEENRRLDADARGLLIFLEQNEIINATGRELVIERALALESAFIDVEDLKWIVLLVLMNQPGQENAFVRMEDLVYNEEPVYLH
jgi:Smg protein